MIISSLNGGLGNMMFQLAAGKSLSLELNTEFAYTMENWQSVTNHKIDHFSTTIFKQISEIALTNLNQKMIVYTEPFFGYSSIPMKNNIILDGYFQSEKHFLKNKDAINNLFFLEKNSSYQDYMFLHVRRGDYLKYPDFHPVCDISYYQQAMKMLGNTNKFIVLSDDIEWCKENIKGKNIEYSNTTTELEDLSIMSSCKGAIIANSSFSWWGAWLSNSTQVVAPKKWFGSKGPQFWQDIYPEKWILI